MACSGTGPQVTLFEMTEQFFQPACHPVLSLLDLDRRRQEFLLVISQLPGPLCEEFRQALQLTKDRFRPGRIACARTPSNAASRASTPRMRCRS
jgi:hypothetical protein